jgi:Gpi18-like mannosyltransferase
VRLAAAGTYLLLPTVLFIGALWGQTDSILAFFILLCAFFMVRGHPVLAAAAFGLAFITKPQAAAALPFLAFWGIRLHPPRVWAQAAAAGVVTALVLSWPFFPENPLRVVNHARESTEVFGHNSSFAFNFWGIFGWFRSDGSEFYYIDWRWWGFVLTVAADAWIIYSLRRARGAGMMALGVGLCTLAFFVFQTRMHERYMFASFLPLLAACFYLNRPLLWASFAGLTVVQYLSPYKAFFHPFFNAGEPGFLHYGWLDRMLEYSPYWWHSPGQFMWFVTSLFTVAVTVALLAFAFLLQHRVHISGVDEEEELRMGRRDILIRSGEETAGSG